MASVKLYLDTRTARQDGTYPLKLSVTFKKTFQINLKVYLLKDQWDGKQVSGHVNKRFLNSYIRQRYVDAENTLLKLTASGELRNISPAELKTRLEGEEKHDNENDDDRVYTVGEHLLLSIDQRYNSESKSQL